MSKAQLQGVYKATSLIGSKWTLIILFNLCITKKGFNELQRLARGISPRTLSLRLKKLVAGGVVAKKVLPMNPPRVEYSLTSKGRALKKVISDLGRWADQV